MDGSSVKYVPKGLKFRAPIYFPFMSGSSGNLTNSEPMNKTPLLAGLRVDTGMKSSLLAGLNVKIVSADKESNFSSKQNSKPRIPSTDTTGSHSPNSKTTKREILDGDEISAKKSKIGGNNDDYNEKIDNDGEYSTKSTKDGTAKTLSTKSTKMSEDGEVVPRTSEELIQQKSGLKDSSALTLNERLLKALTQPNSPAVQVIHTPSASNSPVPVNMSSQSSSASAYSSLVQMNAKSQIPVLSMSSRTLAPQSKYAELLAVIEDMGRDIRPTYSGSRTATERLKRGIVHARALVRECLAETERSARS